MENTAILWIILGIVLILLEVFSIPGIGFLFAGIGAITTGGLISFNITSDYSLVANLAVFFISSCLWAAILWTPLKKLIHTKKGENYKNIVGDNAIAVGKISKGKNGKIKWSGTIVQAKLDDNHNSDTIHDGDEVIIVKTTGNIFIVKGK